MQIVGKYQYMSSENFEDYIKSLGKADLADAFLQATPVVEIQQNGDQWVVVVTSQGKTVTATFKPGEVYDEQLPSQGLVFKVGSAGRKTRIRSSTSSTQPRKGGFDIPGEEVTLDGLFSARRTIS
ncbi:PREDICTED: fatty acid-binding protein homolog 5-like isoform X2 [Vollenhovia emeryi]|uniref:fatty acid-binding protein homolog 5-like isoform X2 n=1 Tax=Vollenhovia emeryi TaxID=411798 RepID=UPI0005F3B1BC|nr:PREDICTED: fatty acid-binding protein homolog 5-like isoform X2 [Vollenhovia emeryi]